MKKNKDDLPAIFQKHQTTLKETSHNDAAGQYMTDLLWQVIDFDAVKTDYMRAYHCDPIPASNDALLYRDGKYFFIEFKDGNMRTEIHEVKRKIFESLLLFGDITDTTISYSRENVSYILVYNKQKSQAYIRTCQKKTLQADEVQDSSSIDTFMHDLGKQAKHNVDYFGLRKQFKGVYFKEVYTCEGQDFEQLFEL